MLVSFPAVKDIRGDDITSPTIVLGDVTIATDGVTFVDLDPLPTITFAVDGSFTMDVPGVTASTVIKFVDQTNPPAWYGPTSEDFLIIDPDVVLSTATIDAVTGTYVVTSADDVREAVTFGPSSSLTGTLDITRVNASVSAVQPDAETLRIVRGCRYEGADAWSWDTSADHSADTVKVVFTSIEPTPETLLVVTGTATTDTVTIPATADFDSDLYYSGYPRQARIAFAVIATDSSSNELPIQLGVAHVTDRGELS